MCLLEYLQGIHMISYFWSSKSKLGSSSGPAFSFVNKFSIKTSSLQMYMWSVEHSQHRKATLKKCRHAPCYDYLGYERSPSRKSQITAQKFEMWSKVHSCSVCVDSINHHKIDLVNSHFLIHAQMIYLKKITIQTIFLKCNQSPLHSPPLIETQWLRVSNWCWSERLYVIYCLSGHY